MELILVWNVFDGLDMFGDVLVNVLLDKMGLLLNMFGCNLMLVVGWRLGKYFFFFLFSIFCVVGVLFFVVVGGDCGLCDFDGEGGGVCFGGFLGLGI